MKTTTQIVDDEYEFLRERGYIDAERYEKETLMMWELLEQKAKVEIGKGRKQNKLFQHARVTSRKYPRFLHIQSHNRRIQAITDLRNRLEPPIHTGMPF